MSEKLTDKNIFITGGAGFIGSNLCEAFLEDGNNVVCYDDLSTGLIGNIESLKKHPKFTFIQGDICALNDLKTAMKGSEVVLHQAALGSVPRSINNPIATNTVNIDGFLNVLEAAKECGIKRLVYASSSSVYGDTQTSPKQEDVLGFQLSPYAVSKRANELYAGVFHKVYGLEIIGLRYFNVFGRKQRPDGAYAAAIPKFISAFIEGNAPEIYGDGLQTRDFTYIDNVVLANQLAASCSNEQAYGNMFNVACGDSITLNDVIDEIKSNLLPRVAGVDKIDVLYKAPRVGDVRTSLADISKGKNILGYQPKYNFAEGLKLAIDWYVDNLSTR